MKLTIDYSHALIATTEFEHAFATLEPAIAQINTAISKKDYASDYASLNLLNDANYQATIKKCIEEKRKLNPSMLILIGIGGSNLGTLAIHEALFGKLYNEKQPPIKVYYADTVDTEYIQTIMQLAEQELQQKKAVLLTVVTKSGTTTETIANFAVFFELVKKYHPHDYCNYVVVTTDKDSPLWLIAQQEQFTILEVPKKVGGRYSVFSAVGLFPLGLLGCDISQLLAGAQDALADCTSSLLAENYAAATSVALYLQYKKNIIIQDMFVFALQLEGIGRWYRQLMGESIGKEHDIHGNLVEVGITPTVSLGTVDLHSVGQLYLGGPRDKNSTFVSVAQTNNEVIISSSRQLETLAMQVRGKSFTLLMNAILQGVKTAYKNHQRPFIAIELPHCNEYYLGQLLQYKMLEIIYLGYLLEVNPFDQPNVELYKQETRFC